MVFAPPIADSEEQASEIARETGLGFSTELGVGQRKPAATSETPSEHAAANEELVRLDQALRQLSPRQEQVVRLRNELKLSFEVDGVALGCSENATQKLCTRAIIKLTQAMGSGVTDE